MIGLARLAKAALVGALVGGACSVPDLDERGKACTETCPSGLPCISGMCGGVQPGETPDGSPNAQGNDASTEASTSTAGSFTLAVTPRAVTLDPGEQNAAITVNVARKAGFSTPIVVSINGLPSSVRASSLTLAGDAPSGVINLGADVGAKAVGQTVQLIGAAGADSAAVAFDVFVTGTLAAFDKDGTFTVPTPAPPSLTVEAWGGGGSGGSINSYGSQEYSGGNGGAGGWAGGRMVLDSGQVLTILVGTGGLRGRGGGSGGGYSSITRGSGMLVVAGGGGGGGGGYAETNTDSGGPGGAGGGASGVNGNGNGGAGNGTGGRAGTSTTGGVTGLCSGAACPGQVAATTGSALLGGSAGAQRSRTVVKGGVPGGGSAIDDDASGGGGGGGWFGGGGGVFVVDSATYVQYKGTGGGGGSGHVDTTIVSPLGADTLLAGSGVTPPRTAVPAYAPGVAVGGTGAVNVSNASTPGGSGRVVVGIAKP